MTPSPAPASASAVRVCQFFLWAFAGLCLCAAVCVFVVSTLSFEALRSVALSVVPPGYEQRFTPGLYARIIFGLRALSLSLSIGAVALAVSAAPLGRVLTRMSRDLLALANELVSKTMSLKYDPLHLVALLIILLWALILRLAFLGEPIRKDEAYTFVYYARRPLFLGLAYYTANNHLLNTLLMHISTSAFGACVWAVRLPTLMAGILLVPATYAMARLYHGKNAALMAVALVSASSPLIEYSFNARGYSLGALLFVTMIVLVGLAGRGSAGAWLGLPAAAALALYAVPTMVYGVGGVFLYLLVSRINLRRALCAMILTAVFTLVLYAPVLATIGFSAIADDKWIAPLAQDLLLPRFTSELLSLWVYWNLDLPVLISVLVGAGAIVALLHPRMLRLPLLAVLLCVAVVGCGLIAAQRVVPYRRTWLFLLPLFLAVAAAGWSVVIRKVGRAEILAAVLSLAVAGWMGTTVLSDKSLRHSGIESVGGRSAEQVVLGMKDHLLRGGQFICSDYFDSSLDFYMVVHKIPYAPSPTGELLIVTPSGKSPERTLDLAGISPDNVPSIRQVARYEDADIYLGQRARSLPFRPSGSGEMGAFTALAARTP